MKYFQLFVLCAVAVFYSSAFDLQRTAQGYSATVSIGSCVETVLDNGYCWLSIPDFGCANSPGKPALPGKMFRIAIADEHAIPRVSAKALSFEEITLKNRIVPVQTYESVTNRVVLVDDAEYSREKIEYPLVSVSEPVCISGTWGVEITVNPVVYRPLLNKVTLYRSLQVSIDMGSAVDKIEISPYESVRGYLAYHYANYADLMERKQGQFGTRTEGYLIITDPKYENADALINTFIPFRQKRFSVEKVTVSAAGGASSAIKTYIQDKYKNGVRYVLFIGAGSSMPCFSNPLNFWEYEKVDGTDKYSDVVSGFFCIDNETHLKNMVAKTIYTEENLEKYPAQVTQYSTYESGSPGTAPHVWAQEKCTRENNWKKGGYAIDWQVPVPNSGKNPTSTVRDHINQNMSKIVTYQGHGAETSLMNGFTSSEKFTNTTVFPFFFSYACFTGTFTTSNCFSQAITVQANGPCCHLGASMVSGMGQKALEYGMAQAISLCPSIKTLGWVVAHGRAFVSDSHSVGSAKIASENAADTNTTTGLTWSDDDENNKKYVLFGDPALPVKPLDISGIAPNAFAAAPKSLGMKSVTPRTLMVSMPVSEVYSLARYDLGGRKIEDIIRNRNFSAGRHMIQLPESSCGVGCHVLRLTGNGSVCVVRTMKLE